MITQVATVIGAPKNVNTKFGRKAVLNVLMADGSQKAVWGPENYTEIMRRCNGERVTLGQETNGKLHLISHAGSALSQPSVATLPAPQATAPAVSTKPTPDQAIDVLVRRYASIMAKCRREVLNQLGITDEDTVQKYAVSLFIQSLKTLEQF